MTKYNVSIGLEVHVELKTKAKLFSYSLNKFDTLPNQNIHPYDMAVLGSLPILNKEAIKLALRACKILNLDINHEVSFDRKGYFYPDNPKNFQISQYERPIGTNGYLIVGDNKVFIRQIHVEEDMAKSIHKDGKSYLDFNRSGTPLIEIVTTPCIKSGEEASLFIKTLQEELRYAGVSDCKIEEGSMRCDVNLSISEDDTLGTKVEIKNIGSISNIKRAIDLELERQINLLENGLSVNQETYRYDDIKDENIFMRSKADVDNHYVKEFNIPPFKLKDEFIADVLENMPLSPNEIRKHLKEADIIDINIEKIINNIDIATYLSYFFESDLNLNSAFNLITEIQGVIGNDFVKISKDDFKNLVNYKDKKIIKSKDLKDVLEQLFSGTSLKDIIKTYQSSLIESEEEILNIIKAVLNEEEESVHDYKSGNERTMKHLMGCVMKKTQGKVRADIASKLLKEELS